MNNDNIFIEWITSFTIEFYQSSGGNHWDILVLEELTNLTYNCWSRQYCLNFLLHWWEVKILITQWELDKGAFRKFWSCYYILKYNCILLYFTLVMIFLKNMKYYSVCLCVFNYVIYVSNTSQGWIRNDWELRKKNKFSVILGDTLFKSISLLKIKVID